MRIRTSLCAIAALGVTGGLAAATGSPAGAGDARTYVVLLDPAASAEEGRAAIERAGGTVEKLNPAVGVATARSTDDGFARDVAATEAVQAAAQERAIGRAPAQSRNKRDREQLERLEAQRRQMRGQEPPAPAGPAPEPLAPLQWDMRMINADSDGSYAVNQGSRAVRVGIIDTGVDGTHPDIAPNFNRDLSRNFTVDMPDVDGACEEEPDGLCSDPADADENGHGTHVAGTIASPLNGQGIGGVAPRSEIVNLRAGQDSGYFFLQATVDALTYCGRPRHRRGQHVVLHRSVAVQLRRQPGRHAGAAGPAAHDHRRRAARAGLRA